MKQEHKSFRGIVNATLHGFQSNASELVRTRSHVTAFFKRLMGTNSMMRKFMGG